jgi:hypothetical protein
MRYRWSRKPPSPFISRISLTWLLTVYVITTSWAGVDPRQSMSEQCCCRQNELLSHVRNAVSVSISVLLNRSDAEKLGLIITT